MSDDRVGSTIAGRYRIVGKLGEGGMGAVYTAIQEPLGREVALKVIRDDLTRDTSAVERFRREATTLSQLAHPNIVTIFDFGSADGAFFLAMEILRGESLRERVNRTGALPPMSTVPIVRDICSGLAVAHAAGVIHRDLKPDNIMLVDSFGRGETAKILDFGVAKLATAPSGATLTQAGMIVGTPGYMAPELTLHGIANDPRSDLYALGVMWFEMMVGRALFEANTPVMLVMKHAMEAPPRPRDLVPSYGITGELEDLVLQLLAKEPASRPASAADVVRLLDAIRGVSHSSLPRDLISTPGATAAPSATTPTVSTMPGLGSFRSILSNPSEPHAASAQPSPSKGSLAAALRRPALLFSAAGLLVAVSVIALVLAAIDGARPSPPPASPPVATVPVAETVLPIRTTAIVPPIPQAAPLPPMPELATPPAIVPIAVRPAPNKPAMKRAPKKPAANRLEPKQPAAKKPIVPELED